MKELGNYKQLSHEQKDSLIELLWHALKQCHHCYHSLKDVATTGYKTRQVFEIKFQLQTSAYLHHDESGVRVEGQLQWHAFYPSKAVNSYEF